jgi:hypothetical protein
VTFAGEWDNPSSTCQITATAVEWSEKISASLTVARN